MIRAIRAEWAECKAEINRVWPMPTMAELNAVADHELEKSLANLRAVLASVFMPVPCMVARWLARRFPPAD